MAVKIIQQAKNDESYKERKYRNSEKGFDVKKIHVKHCVKKPSRKDSVSLKNEKSELFDDEDGYLEEAKVTDGSDQKQDLSENENQLSNNEEPDQGVLKHAI